MKNNLIYSILMFLAPGRDEKRKWKRANRALMAVAVAVAVVVVMVVTLQQQLLLWFIHVHMHSHGKHQDALPSNPIPSVTILECVCIFHPATTFSTGICIQLLDNNKNQLLYRRNEYLLSWSRVLHCIVCTQRRLRWEDRASRSTQILD